MRSRAHLRLVRSVEFTSGELEAHHRAGWRLFRDAALVLLGVGLGLFLALVGCGR